MATLAWPFGDKQNINFFKREDHLDPPVLLQAQMSDGKGLFFPKGMTHIFYMAKIIAKKITLCIVFTALCGTTFAE